MRNKKITKKLLCKQKRAYDRLAKETMRDTRLLAFLIKDCVHPFKNDPLSFIQKGIDSDQGHIPYVGGEISFVSGAYIVPDLLFTMKKGEWSACGNIEFQKDRPKAQACVFDLGIERFQDRTRKDPKDDAGTGNELDDLRSRKRGA